MHTMCCTFTIIYTLKFLPILIKTYNLNKRVNKFCWHSSQILVHQIVTESHEVFREASQMIPFCSHSRLEVEVRYGCWWHHQKLQIKVFLSFFILATCALVQSCFRCLMESQFFLPRMLSIEMANLWIISRVDTGMYRVNTRRSTSWYLKWFSVGGVWNSKNRKLSKAGISVTWELVPDSQNSRKNFR